MSTATQTPGQHITIGTLFVPPGKNGFCCCDTADCAHNWNDNAAGGRN